MNLVKWNPWSEMDAFQNGINRLFEDDFFAAFKTHDEFLMDSSKPAVDIYENDNSIVIKAELPGVDMKDVDVELKDRILTLKGERSYEKEMEEDTYYRKERAYGKFQRAFSLPIDVDANKIKADYRDGILRIDIPKPEERKPKKIEVH